MKLLPWLLLTAVPAAASNKRQATRIVGINIRITAIALEDADRYVEVGPDAANLDLTTSAADADTFILQDGTGHLLVDIGYEYEQFGSGTAIIVLPIAAATLPTAVVPFLLDYELYLLTASNYLALTCAPQSNGYLNCVAGASALTKFGQCESAVYNPLLVATSTSGLSAICAASLAFPVYVDHFEYANLGSVNGGVGTGANGGSTAAPTSAAQGSCSVTLMLYIASSTTYVPEGYQGAAPSVPTPVFGYGCSPVTSTIHISSRSASFQTSSTIRRGG